VDSVPTLLLPAMVLATTTVAISLKRDKKLSEKGNPEDDLKPTKG